MDRDEIFQLSVNELKEKLRELGLPVTGRKSTLQDRLCEHFGVVVEDDGSDFEDATSAAASELRQGPVERTPFTLRDIQESLNQFSGVGQPAVKEWVEEFEENAIAVQWSEIQKFIYAKQLLKGAAKIFVRSQRGVTDWYSLKSVLLKEFGVKISSMEVHRQLRNRRKRSNEDFREYLYQLMEIGRPISLDEPSLIEYFIEGIPDTRAGKINLYQAKDIEQLKEQISVYEKVRSIRPPINPNQSRQIVKSESVTEHQSVERRRCFKCGTVGHLASSCPKVDNKCFNCGESGHRAAQCKTRVEVKKERANTLTNVLLGKSSKCVIFKELSVNGFKFCALLDTGCDLCLLRYDVLMMLGDIKLDNEKRCLMGIGGSELITMGSFACEIRVDKIDISETFHVVRERDMCYSAIIGNSVLSSVNLKITEEGVTFRPRKTLVPATETKRNVDTDKEKGNIVKGPDNPMVEWLHDFREVCLVAGVNCAEMELSHLDRVFASKIKNIIQTYQPQRQHRSPIEMKITLTDDVPVFQGPRRMPYVDKRIVEQQVGKWLDEGIIRASNSNYASPVVLVAKKDGSKRLCCDYRRLNMKIMRDNFPMPLIDDVLERLKGARVFTTLDLENGFFHVPMEESSRKFTSFVTHSGQYEFLFVPFGISNSPAVFSRFISTVLRDLIQDGTCVTYMDDLIIPSKDYDEGIRKLQQVLTRASQYNLKIKWKKCQFLMKKVEFLGYLVENGTIRPSEAKVKAVKNFPLPNDRKSVQRYLGLTSYFRRFIEGYATIAKPLSDLLRQDNKLKMSDEQVAALQQLKNALISAPVLRLYNPKAVTEVHTDACMYGYGGVLLQKDADDQHFHPIQYMSRKTTPMEEKYHSYELEVLAIVEALKKWRVYLLGIKFKIVTDCNAFTMTMRKKDVPLRVSRWALFLQDFNYEIEHRSGSKMKHVDALSRVSCLLLEDTLHYRLQQAQKNDDWVRAVMKALEYGDYEDFFIKKDVLYKDPTKELIVVPALMEEEIIRIAHKQGHFSAKKTQDAIEKTFFIPKIASKTERVVKSCIECIISESKAGKKEGLLTPIRKENEPLGTYHVDHVGPMQTTNKSYNYIFVVVDAFSKFVWLYPTRNTGAEGVVTCLRKQAAVFGNPKRIISDRGTAFTAHIFQEYCEREGIQHLLIATGVPRGNGQVERMHKIIVPMLSKLCVESPGCWYKHLDKVQQTINITPPRSTKISPFRLLTGVDMRINAITELRDLLNDTNIEELDTSREMLRKTAQENIAKIQEENRRSFNKHRKREKEYAIHELVAIKRTQYGTGLKLKPKYFGPYRVVRVLQHGRYEVEKVGDHEGPRRTKTVAEYMKKWDSSFGTNE